ncbi:phage portal protein [Acholeplasma sp. OttesenSCG-928-E16]|nr:phage portal protein [Acholeplasma sp. OttesenSCG-928-E16]
MGLFKRKKKIPNTFSEISLVNNFNQTFTPFGDNITSSDVVMICIDRVASQCAKLKGRHIKHDGEGVQTDKKSDIAYLLKHRPNELMTPYQFIYKVVTLLLLNDNVFIYPKYDKSTYELIGLYPLNPTMVEPIEDLSESLYYKFYFSDGTNYTLPIENIIHLKRFYSKNDIFGGNSSNGSHEALLKTLKINDSLLQGIETAMFSSFQIKGLLKINGMLKDSDKDKQLAEFHKSLNNANKKGSSIIPTDLKSEYVPLNTDPKMVDEKTLDFLQSKILDYFGVSKEIFQNNHDETKFNAFYEATIEPLAIQLSEAFSFSLLTTNQLKAGEEIIFFSERLQYASWSTKVTAIEKLMGLGIMTLNESRGLLGLEPVENGNKRLQSLNYVDADKANLYQVGGSEDETK